MSKKKWTKWRAPDGVARCVALDADGNRCRRRAEWVGPYFGDSEFRSHTADHVGWVVAEMCRKHASEVK